MSRSQPNHVVNTLQPQLPPSHPAPPAPSDVAPTTSAELLKHKNRLQEYTQRAAIPLPVYQTINEGPQHAPKFRSTVFVDGETYTSANTFAHRKAAEQDVAKLALECINQKIKDEGCPLIYEDMIFCKSILNEFAVKTSLERPVYNTIQPEGNLPVFISSMVFNGVTYTGEAGKNKKEAEQLAARTVIRSLLGTSGSGTILFEIIKSKVKLFDALRKVKDPNYGAESMGLNTKHSPGNLVSCVTETGNVNHNAQASVGTINVQAVYRTNNMQSASGVNNVQAADAANVQAANAPHIVQAANVTNNVLQSATHTVLPSATHSMLPSATHNVLPSATHNVLPSATHSMLPSATHNVLPSATHNVLPSATNNVRPIATHNVLASPTHNVLPSATNNVRPSPTHNVLTSPTLGTSTTMIMPYHQFNVPVEEQPLEGGPSTSKKRRKNKKKADKRARADDALAVVPLPISQAPPATPLRLVRYTA